MTFSSKEVGSTQNSWIPSPPITAPRNVKIMSHPAQHQQLSPLPPPDHTAPSSTAEQSYCPMGWSFSPPVLTCGEQGEGGEDAPAGPRCSKAKQGENISALIASRHLKMNAWLQVSSSRAINLDWSLRPKKCQVLRAFLSLCDE